MKGEISLKHRGVSLGWENGPSILFHIENLRGSDFHTLHHQRFAVSSDYSNMLYIQEKFMLCANCISDATLKGKSAHNTEMLVCVHD